MAFFKYAPKMLGADSSKNYKGILYTSTGVKRVRPYIWLDPVAFQVIPGGNNNSTQYTDTYVSGELLQAYPYGNTPIDLGPAKFIWHDSSPTPPQTSNMIHSEDNIDNESIESNE